MLGIIAAINNFSFGVIETKEIRGNKKYRIVAVMAVKTNPVKIPCNHESFLNMRQSFKIV